MDPDYQGIFELLQSSVGKTMYDMQGILWRNF